MMDRREFMKTVAVAGGAALAGPGYALDALARSGTAPPRLVLLYAPCTVNRNFLSPYNRSVGYTPFLEKFASGATVFADVQAECGMSGTCYASIFSGCYADRHGIFEQPSIVGDDVHMITETFIGAGYDSYFWGGHPMATYQMNYGKGVAGENSSKLPLLAGDAMFDGILEKLASDQSYRAFVLTNFTVTHATYMPPDAHLYDAPEEFKRYNELYQKEQWVYLAYSFDDTIKRMGLSHNEKVKFISAVNYLYKLNISRLDLLFGRVVEKIENSGLIDESLIAFTADHGETLFRDNTFFQYSHGFQLAPEVLAVPLIIRAPRGILKTGIVDFPVRSIDIFPTLAGLCGIDVKAEHDIEGIDVSAAAAGNEQAPSLLQYSHTNPIFELAEFNLRAAESDVALRLFRPDNPYSIWLAVKDGGTVVKLKKFSVDGPLEFGVFDLDKDFEERNNLFDPSTEYHRKLRDELFVYKSRTVKKIKEVKEKKSGKDIEDREKLEKLKDMGYIK